MHFYSLLEIHKYINTKTKCSKSPFALSIRFKRPNKDKYKGFLGFCIANDF